MSAEWARAARWFAPGAVWALAGCATVAAPTPLAEPRPTGLGTVVEVAPEPEGPAAIAARATRDTPERAKAMGQAQHSGAVRYVGEHVFAGPSTLNPQGLRVQDFELDNGLRVLLLEDHSAPVFAYQTWFAVGSRHERPGKTGIAHLFEHLMFKETRNLKEGEFDRLMEMQGSETDAATWLDWTMYREVLPAGQLPLVVRLEADRMQHMVLSEAQLESEREVVKNERRYRVDNDPEGTMFEVMYDLAFTAHPYKWPTIGWMKDIEGITLEDCVAFYKQHYAPNRATLVLAGDFDPQEALTLINAYYGPMERQPEAEERVEPEPRQVAERRRSLVMPLTSPKLLMGYHVPGMTDPAYPALHVAHQVLFGGDSGRLVRLLVDETELASDADAWVGEFAHPSLYEILVTLHEGEDPDRVEGLIDEELVKLAKKPVSQAELDKAKNRIEIEFLRELQELDERAYQLGHYAVTAGDWRRLFQVLEQTRAVTAPQVQEVAERYLRRTNRTVVLALPQ